MCMLWVRGPVFRKQIKDLAENIMKDTVKFAMQYPSFSENFDSIQDLEFIINDKTEVLKIKELLEDGGYTMDLSNEFHHMIFSNMNEFTCYMCQQHWTVFISKCEKKFITSDNPVSVYLPNKTGFGGPHIIDREHLFSITPDICIQTGPPKTNGKKFKRKAIYKKDSHQIGGINFAISNKAYNYSYSKSRSELEDVKALYNIFKGRSI